MYVMAESSWCMVVSWTYGAGYSVVYHARVDTLENSELIKYRLISHMNGSTFASPLPDGTAWCPLLSPPTDAWWRHQMETFFALLTLCEWNPPVTSGFPSQRQLTRGLDVDLRQNKRLSKQSRRWWFETTSRSFLRHGNVCPIAWCIRWRKVVSMRYFLTEQPVLCRIGLASRHTKTFNLTEVAQVWCLLLPGGAL